jgi:hypothetical protein
MIALAALGAALVAFFVHELRGFVYLPGTDAYYYALQAQSLLDTGHLKVADHGAVHYLVASLAWLGLPLEAAFRATLAAIFTLYQLGMLLLVLRLRERAQLVAALLWALSSPLIAFHTIEFPSLTLGLATLPFWFWLVLMRSGKWIYWLGTLLTVSALVHPASAAVALLFAAAVVLIAVLEKEGVRRRFKLFIPAVAGCIMLVVGAAATFLSIKTRLTALRPGWPGLLSLANSADVPREVSFTIVAAWLLVAVGFIVAWRTGLRRWTLFTGVLLALPLWPDHHDGLDGLGGRLSLLFVLAALPLLAVLWNDLAENSKISSFGSRAAVQKLAAAAALIAIALMPFRLRAYHSLLMADDYNAYERVVAALREADVPMLIAHRGLDFFYSYRLRRDAFHFDPEPEWNRKKIWRVATRITPEEVAYYSPPGCHWGETGKMIRGTDYLLVREDCWEQLRAQVTRDDNPDLYTELWESSENPSQQRPGFLRARYQNSNLTHQD